MTMLRTEIRRYFSVAEWKRGLSIKVAYVLLHQADILLTNFAISDGFREINPIMRGLLDTPVQLLAFKLIIPLFIAWLIPARLLLPALVFLLGVIVFNLVQLSFFL